MVKIKWPRALKGKTGWVFLDFLFLFLLNLIDSIFSTYSYNFLKLHVCREKGPRERVQCSSGNVGGFWCERISTLFTHIYRYNPHTYGISVCRCHVFKRAWI